MIKWLNGDDDSLDDKEVWKCDFDDYTLENLKSRLSNGGKLVDKGKAKAGDEKKKKKKKEAQL